MHCAKCGTANPPGNNFCQHCGNALARVCIKCGAENSPASNFCGQCGTSLVPHENTPRGVSPARKSATGLSVVTAEADASALDGERKTVTALFADIKGSTELMEGLDPEEARAIIDPALKLMIGAVHRYGGYVVQSTGDGIFALFGAPLAHEDHPQRALYAALRLQEELKRYSAKVLVEGGTPIQGRVGVNTGEVVVRSITTGAGQTEYTPIGHTTNLASRMQTAAPVGSIALSEATRILCEGYFILKPLGATRVKGVSEPVNVYEVTGLGPLRTRLQRAAGRGFTKFVGRQREMDALKHAAALAREGHGQIVAAMADPGVGKSRLFFEFKAASQSGWMVLETFSVSHGKASAYLPVLDLLQGYFKIAGGDDARTRREKVAGKITILDRSLADTLPYLFSLLGIAESEDPLADMDGHLKKRRTLDAIKRILLRESLNQPLMVIFEDLHWIDDETQSLLNLLAGALATARILLLVNYRPEYSHQWNSKTCYTQLRLDPLGKESADEMLTALLGNGADLLPLKRLIVERTEGNPFFMEEIVQVLLDEGALMRGDNAMTLTRPLGDLKIPPTVQAILAARIDRLPADEKDLLRTLAVIGREFRISLLAPVIGLPEDRLNPMLSRLQLAEFIYEQPAAGDTEYVFKHALTQEVAYSAMLLERRKLLHERTAQALESIYADRLEDHLDELAHHYSRADNAEKAVHYLKLAGVQAGRRSAYEEAIASLTKAIELLLKQPESRERDMLELDVRVALGPFYAAVRGLAGPEAEPQIRRLEQLCQRVGESPELISALYALWSVNLSRGRLGQALPLAERFMRLAATLDDPIAIGGAHGAVGVTALWMGEFLSAREHLQHANAAFQPDLPRYLPMQMAPVIPSQCQFGWAQWMLGYPAQASMAMRRALALADQLKRPFNTAFALQYAVALADFMRDYRSIERNIETLIEISRENGLMAWIDSANLSLGHMLVFKGEHARGIEMMRDALEGLREHGAELTRSLSLPLLAESLLRAGRTGEGLAMVEQAFADSVITGVRIMEAETHRLQGELVLQQNASNGAEARKCFTHAIEVARKQSAKAWELRATVSLARLLAKRGQPDEARAMLAEIYHSFTEGFDTADLIAAKSLLGELDH